MQTRQLFDNYAIEIANVVANRGTCPRAKVGAIITKERQIISTGYNGACTGVEHCVDVGCELDDNHCIRAVHAEANAISQAAKYGISVKGGTIYCTHCPCYNCARLLVNSGIKTVLYQKEYHAQERTQLLFRQLNTFGFILRKII